MAQIETDRFEKEALLESQASESSSAFSLSGHILSESTSALKSMEVGILRIPTFKANRGHNETKELLKEAKEVSEEKVSLDFLGPLSSLLKA